jgi:hypothetical protein
MHSALLHTHNLLRWVVLVLGVLAIVRQAQGIGGRIPYDRARKAAAMFMGSVHLQLLLGLLLLMNSPTVRAAMRDMETTMQDAALRKVVIEHPALMVGAALVVTWGAMLSKSRPTDANRHQVGLVTMSLSLIVILAGIPWGRALFPGM